MIKLIILELEKNRNWHWMWSTFYFHKKHKGFIFALINNFSQIYFQHLLKTLFYLILNKKKKRYLFL